MKSIIRKLIRMLDGDIEPNTRTMKIEVKRASYVAGYYWRIVGGNGEPLAHSETYSSKYAAKKTAWRVWEEFTRGNVVVREVKWEEEQ